MTILVSRPSANRNTPKINPNVETKYVTIKVIISNVKLRIESTTVRTVKITQS